MAVAWEGGGCVGSGLCRAWVEWDSGVTFRTARIPWRNGLTVVWGHTCHCTPEAEVNFEASLGYMTRPCLTKGKKKKNKHKPG